MNRQIRYNTKHDAMYSVSPLKWYEGKCGDPNCKACETRPDVPVFDERDQIIDLDL
jgi:hypothetical protein